MKFLLHFYDLHQRAGIQRAITELSNVLVEKEHEVVLAVSTPRAAVAFPLDRRVLVQETANPEPREYGMAAWPQRIAWALRAGRILRDLVQHHHPTVVVDHGTSFGLLYPLRSINKVPFILQCHFPVGAPHGASLHRMLSLLSRSKTVVALTPGIAKDMQSVGYRNVEVIPNVLPVGAAPAPYEEPIRRTGLLMGRGKTPQKGFDLFLRALARTRLDGWRFRIVGPEVDSDPLLLGLIQKHHLQSQVALLPADSDPYALLRSCSCLIMPSRYEALPMIALEALSIGRPLIASNVDGLRDLVVPDVNGILFQADNVAALSEALQSMGDNLERLTGFAKNASASVERFRGPIVAGAWSVLVDRLVNPSIGADLSIRHA